MPCASSRSSRMVVCTSERSVSSIGTSVPVSPSSASSRASPSLTASATRCCCAPSCRLRSIARRDVSAAFTMRRRDACSSRLRSASCSSDACSAESSRTLCNASPSCRASSTSARSSSVVNAGASAGRCTTIKPSSSPRCAMGAMRRSPAPVDEASATTPPPTPDRRCAPGRRPRVRGRREPIARTGGTACSRRGSSSPPVPVQISASASRIPPGNASTSCSRTSSIGTDRVMRAPRVATRSSTEPRRRPTRPRPSSARRWRAGTASTMRHDGCDQAGDQHPAGRAVRRTGDADDDDEVHGRGEHGEPGDGGRLGQRALRDAHRRQPRSQQRSHREQRQTRREPHQQRRRHVDHQLENDEDGHVAEVGHRGRRQPRPHGVAGRHPGHHSARRMVVTRSRVARCPGHAARTLARMRASGNTASRAVTASGGTYCNGV